MNASHRRHDISDRTWKLLEAHVPGREGVWEGLRNVLVDESDHEWLMIDASHCNVHPHAAGAKGGNQGMSRTIRGLNTKRHLAVEAHGLPLRVVITQGTAADCTQAGRLIEGLTADHLIADNGYDSTAIVEQAGSQGMNVVIPPRQHRTEPRSYDEDLYKLGHCRGKILILLVAPACSVLPKASWLPPSHTNLFTLSVAVISAAQ